MRGINYLLIALAAVLEAGISSLSLIYHILQSYPVKLAIYHQLTEDSYGGGYINGAYYPYKKEKYLVTLNKRRLKEKKVVTLWQVIY